MSARRRGKAGGREGLGRTRLPRFADVPVFALTMLIDIVQVPQRLLGPAPFPLDRLVAILGVLLEENDVESRPPAPQFTIPGEYTDMEITRVHIHGAVCHTLSYCPQVTDIAWQIMDLTRSRLLHRTTPADRLDGPPMFKCGVSYEVALALARDLEIPLNGLMWDPA